MNDEDRGGSSRRNLLEDFVIRFLQILRSPIDPSGVYDTGESIDLVWKTEWVAISLIRRLTFPISLTILAEISMPVITFDHDGTRQAALPEDVILHMEYLRTLLGAGFELQVIGEECLWVASKDFEEIPPSEILEMLVPPSSNVQPS